MQLTRLLILLVLVVLTAAACSKGGHGEGEGPEVDSFNVPTAAVQASTQTGFTEVTGTVEGRVVVPVSTKLMSEITFMGFEEGDRVARGDLLARIDDSDIAAMRAEAAAYREEASAALIEVDAAIAQGEAGKAQAKAALAQAEAAHADARRDAERFRRLADEDTVPEAQAEKYELGLEVAEENVNLARSAVNQAEAGIEQARAKIPQVKAKSSQAAAKDAQAAAMQDYATLTAPFDGVITAKMSEPGQLSIPGHPIYMVADDSAFRVVADVAENLAGHLSVNSPVEVIYEEQGAELVAGGTIAVISAAANPGSHTVRIEIDLEPIDGLFTGRFVRVRVPSGERSALLIPETAIVREGELTFVWRVSRDGKLNRTPVEIGEPADGMVAVIRGLSEGDQVVTSPTEELYPGARVD
jgi:multidrug efflux pump subunit AcrA (membrane-fusion protein)